MIETPKKECNMYYYLKNGEYYRCRQNKNDTCNKRGKSGMRLAKCNPSSVDRIKIQDEELEKLRTLVESKKTRKMSQSSSSPSSVYGST